MWLKQTQNSSFRESIKTLEADIQHANSLAAALPRDSSQDSFQMKVSYSLFAPFLFFLIDWMDYNYLEYLPSCLGLFHILVYKEYVDGTPNMSQEERKASLREFYAVIYPSLKQLEGALNLMEDSHKSAEFSDISSNEGLKEKKSAHKGWERDDECGICMETAGSLVVLPNCGHSMCISCYHNWYVRSQSCPFCRGSLKRVSSGDLWILTGNCDVVDNITIANENLRQLYLYIEQLPLMISDDHFLSYDYMF